ncbi:MAG TPA: kynureninase [Isosphaeraceae bacterium]
MRDRGDPLAHFRSEFFLPPGRIYLDGNSLGPLSRRAEEATLRVLEDWKARAIGGWIDGQPAWFTLAEGLGAAMAGLVGADEDEVVVANSTTVNLHQLLATLYRPAAGRAKILADALSFPTDLYAIESHLRLRGLDPATHLVLVDSADGRTLSEGAIVEALTGEVALAVLPTVVYRSGQLLDVARIAAEGRARGVVVGFDASHSVGVVPHALAAWGVDCAFWCSYKYLNGGPGAVGALYLNRRHFDVAPGLAGWFGGRKDRQFAMARRFEPAAGAGALQIGTPPILGMAPLIGALEMVREAGIEAIRAKSLALTAYLRELADSELAGFGFELATPIEDNRRGGHLALVHPEAPRICRAWIAAGVIPDHRPPDIIRIAPAPLYTRFEDCREAVGRLRRIMEGRAYEAYPADRGLIT